MLLSTTFLLNNRDDAIEKRGRKKNGILYKFIYFLTYLHLLKLVNQS